MIRKGRKPKPRNEEEMLQQIEERAANKLRKVDHRNAFKRAKQIVKLNMVPFLGAARNQVRRRPKSRKKS
jgi:hypothetical protein